MNWAVFLVQLLVLVLVLMGAEAFQNGAPLSACISIFPDGHPKEANGFGNGSFVLDLSQFKIGKGYGYTPGNSYTRKLDHFCHSVYFKCPGMCDAIS